MVGDAKQFHRINGFLSLQLKQRFKLGSRLWLTNNLRYIVSKSSGHPILKI
jgi:hypothetical protein